MAYDLSVCIPARNEEWLAHTVQDILEHKRGKTEVIVFLDGQWANPGIPDHKDVRIIYVSESIGQRAGTNKCVRLSRAKYIMKLDAHCSMSEGFDVEMSKAFEETGDNVVMSPTMRNLWVFDWKCMKCGKRTYQGPTPKSCEDCDNTTDFQKKVVWNAKPSPQSTAYCFDTEPHFQYHNDWKRKQEGELVESMSLQGSCFMMTRDKYWELEIGDESFGSWGSQGLQVACSFWLSGGRVIINTRCYYAHCFRTQGGDFSFPYPQHQSKINAAKALAREKMLENKWPKQTRPLSWLVDKFKPITGGGKWVGWHDPGGKEVLDKVNEAGKEFGKPNEPTKGILYFTDNELPLKLARNVQARIRKIAEDEGMRLVSSSRKPMDKMGKNVVTPEPRGYLTMFKQILAGLEALDTDIVFMAEHDVLYPPEHFQFTPDDEHTFYYDQNWWKVGNGNLAVHWNADQVSGLCAYRQILIDHYKQRIETFDPDNFDRKFEPLSGHGSESWKADVPHIDVRHGRNLTYNKWGLDDFRNKATAVNFEQSTIDKIPGWVDLDVIIRKINEG